ncbi:hypothetical protein HDE_06236 [Halotydeus destructor]|nr:hypothetical protein HDE_06971 [Halotydeus destructor]KAI1293675.1 hypothetical protein HDE_06236 [Halotydeus destructor]
MFFETSARVLRYMDIVGDDNAKTWFNVAEFVVPVVGLTVMAAAFDNSVRDQHQLEKNIRNALIGLDEPKASAELRYQIDRLLFEMNQDKICSPTAWNLFKVNKHMILNYAGALLPFTIMLVNLCGIKQRFKEVP